MRAMPASYDDAVTELYRGQHAAFVSERKRLAGELKAAGDKEGAARLAKLPRPPISAWAVNQLWWRDRAELEAMLATAARLRAGELGAAAAHRETIARLRARAAAILAEAGHGTSEATLRRVTTTLAAIAATGGFAPDPPGALADDRDPPGFEALGLPAPAPRPAPTPRPALTLVPPAAADDEQRRREAEEAHRRAEAAALRRRLEEEAARRQAERQRVEAALRTAIGEVDRLARELAQLRASIGGAEDRLANARAIAADLEARLAKLAAS